MSVTSNEPETGFLGNGDKGPDIQGATIGTDDRAFSLRSERGTGGQSTGRVYTITYRATDASGNHERCSDGHRHGADEQQWQLDQTT